MGNPLIIHEEDDSVVTVREVDDVTIITSPGGAGDGRQYRGIINYDGGHAGTHYGDLIHLDGGGAADGSRYSI
jgi:hypothetical protein